MKYVLLTGISLLAALFLAAAHPARAYEYVTSTPNGGCLICHSFAGGGTGKQHGLHIDEPNSLDCTNCHPDNFGGKNVTASKCIACHPKNNVGICSLVKFSPHPTAGEQACLSCHSVKAAPEKTPAIEGCLAECDLQINPKTFNLYRAVINPIQFFSIKADRNNSMSFSRPISIYWENPGIDDIIKLRIGEKTILGFIRVDPGNLVVGNFTVQVTYGDLNETACGTITVKDTSASSFIQPKRVELPDECGASQVK